MTNMKSESHGQSASSSHDRGLSRRMTIVFKENNSGSSLSELVREIDFNRKMYTLQRYTVDFPYFFFFQPTPRDLDNDSSRANKGKK